MKDNLDGHRTELADGQLLKPECPLNEVENLAEQAGELVYNWGLKRVHGRIWTHLFVASSPLDAAALVERLDISKALVSISLREMLAFRLIVSAGKSPQGTLLYDVNHDFFSVVRALLEQRGQAILDRLAGAQQTLAQTFPQKTDCGLAQSKVDQMGTLIAQASDLIMAVVQQKSLHLGEGATARP